MIREASEVFHADLLDKLGIAQDYNGSREIVMAVPPGVLVQPVPEGHVVEKRDLFHEGVPIETNKRHHVHVQHSTDLPVGRLPDGEGHQG